MALAVQLYSVRENAFLLMLVDYTDLISIHLWEKEQHSPEVCNLGHEHSCSGWAGVMGFLCFSPFYFCLHVIPENLLMVGLKEVQNDINFGNNYSRNGVDLK